MSKKINVNPDHYKVAGRERQGENVLAAMHKQAYAQQSAVSRWASQRDRVTAPPSASPPDPSEKAELPKKASSRGKSKSRALAAGGVRRQASTTRHVSQKIAKPRKKESRETTKRAKRSSGR